MDIVKNDNIGPAYKLVNCQSGKVVKGLIAGDRLKVAEEDNLPLQIRLPSQLQRVQAASQAQAEADKRNTGSQAELATQAENSTQQNIQRDIIRPNSKRYGQPAAKQQCGTQVESAVADRTFTQQQQQLRLHPQLHSGRQGQSPIIHSGTQQQDQLQPAHSGKQKQPVSTDTVSGHELLSKIPSFSQTLSVHTP